MDKKEIRRIAKEYAHIVSQELSPVAIILYGSHAKGYANENSDIDIAVIYDGFSGD